MTREIFCYYKEENGEILGFSKVENPEYKDEKFVLIPLDDARKFYSGEVIVTDWMVDNESGTVGGGSPALIKKTSKGIISKARMFPDKTYIEVYKPTEDADVIVSIFPKHVLIDKSKKIDVTIFVVCEDDPTMLIDCVNLNNRKRSNIIETTEKIAVFVRGNDKENFTFSLEHKEYEK